MKRRRTPPSDEIAGGRGLPDGEDRRRSSGSRRQEDWPCGRRQRSKAEKGGEKKWSPLNYLSLVLCGEENKKRLLLKQEGSNRFC